MLLGVVTRHSRARVIGQGFDRSLRRGRTSNGVKRSTRVIHTIGVYSTNGTNNTNNTGGIGDMEDMVDIDA